MTYEDVMAKLQELGTAQNHKIYRRHGCDIDQYGVSVANLKVVLKSIKGDAKLGRDLLFSNHADAMYLAQWLVAPQQLTNEEFEERILASNYYMLIETAILSIIVKDPSRTVELLQRWLDHDEPRLRQAAYSLYAMHVSHRADEQLDLEDLKHRLEHVSKAIHGEANRVRYAMNGFVIAVGAYVAPLHPLATAVAAAVGEVHVSMGETACQVPFAPASLAKIAALNRIGRKRKL